MSATDIELFRSGDRVFIETLYARQRGKLLAYARHYLHDRDEAEDAVAETWEVAWEQRDEYQGAGALDSWMLKLCVSICMDRLHSQKREAKLLKWSVDLDHIEVDERVAETAAIMMQYAANTVNAAVDALPPKQRRTVELRMLDDKSTAEVAEHMHCAEETVNANLYEAMQKLKPKTLTAANVLSAARKALDSGTQDNCL